MREQYRGYLVSFAALLIVLAGMFGASFVFTKGQSQSKAHAQLATSARPVASHMVTMHTVMNPRIESGGLQAVRTRICVASPVVSSPGS